MEGRKLGWLRVFAVAALLGILGLSISFFPSYARSPSATIPQIRQTISVTVNESQSANILVLVNNSGSPLGWTSLKLSYIVPNPGIKITTDPLLFAEGPIVAGSDNFSLAIGISVAGNVSVGQYTLPFTLYARSSLYAPSISTIVNFNLVIAVMKSTPRPFPILLLFPPFILVAAGTMIGIVIRWSKDWNISDLKK